MSTIIIVVGLLIIGLGFLYKAKPDLISVYMSTCQKENFDIFGLSTMVRNCFIAIGILVIIGAVVLKSFDLGAYSPLLMIAIIMTGAIIIIIKTDKYDHNKEKGNVRIRNAVIILVIIFTNGFISYDLISTKTIFKEDSIIFTGSYGLTVNISDVESVELIDEIPLIKHRAKGISVGKTKKGKFELESFGKCRLLISSDIAPYLVIKNKNGERIIVNIKGKSKTEDIYNQMKFLLDK